MNSVCIQWQPKVTQWIESDEDVKVGDIAEQPGSMFGETGTVIAVEPLS